MEKAVSYIEIDVPVCSLTYGESPCTAAGAEGSECYNTLKTCQDTENYARVTEEVRFGWPDADDQGEVECIPSITKIAFRPQQVSLGENIGVRASLTVSLMDHPDADIGAGRDPYWRTRGGDAYTTGTFWGKFRARHVYMSGATVRYVQGFEGQTREMMEARTFVIEEISGPGLDGRVTITAKDVLKLTDDDKAQCPHISSGRLASAISSSGSCTLSPSGVGDAEYPSSGYVTIGGSEICAFTRSGDSLSLSRGQFGTDADEHDQGDIVQLCKCFFDAEGNGMDIADIIYDLLVNYSVVPPEWITIDDWLEKTDAFLQGRRYYAIIAEPTSVRDLLNEIVYQAGIILWTDDIAQQVRFDVVRHTPPRNLIMDEDNTVQGSFKVKDQPKKRLSQVWVYYGQINPLDGDSISNFSAASAVIDEEMDENYGIPSIKKIFSRWIPKTNRPAATDVGYFLLSRFRTAPRQFEFSVWRGNPTLALAGRYDIQAWPLQLASGERDTVPAQITELNPGDDYVDATAEEISWHVYADQPDQGFLVVIDTNGSNINFRTEFNHAYNLPPEGEIVTCLIEAGIIVTSTSSGAYAFDCGDWSDASGVTVRVINRGTILGKAGAGGRGGWATDAAGSGSAGGPALHASSPIEIVNEGIIAAGGGGGGGGGGANVPGGKAGSGGGGGGGAGNLSAGGSSNGQAGTMFSGGAGGPGENLEHGPVCGSGGRGGDAGSAGQVGAWAEGSSGEKGAPGAGGSAGPAVVGNSHITWSPIGDIRGARVG